MSDFREQIPIAVRKVALSMSAETDSISVGIATAITGTSGELRQRGAEALVEEICHANTRALLYALSHGVEAEEILPSPEVVRSTRAIVQRGLSHDNMLRGYRVAAAYCCERWLQATGRYCEDPAHAMDVARFGTAFVLRWLDAVSDQLSVEFRDEAERIAREGTFAWADFVQRLLSRDDVDVHDASLRLGYDLKATHMAFVLSHHRTDDDFPLEATARAIAGTMTRSRPLIVRVDTATTWCWIQTHAHEKMHKFEAPVICGIGGPAKGLAGFRRSHWEAQEALRVVRESARPSGTVARFDEIEIEALFGVDPNRRHSFMESKLGDLLGHNPEQVRLRETLSAYFFNNCNYRAAASDLGLHHNTVRYRISQVEEIIGYPISKHRLALELALHLSRNYNS